MNFFIQNSPTDARVLARNLLLTFGLFVTVMLPIVVAEGCVKRPSLEPTPGVAPQQFSTP